MKHIVCLFFLLYCCCLSYFAFSQSKTYLVKGEIQDSTNHKPLDLATVYVKDPKDSSLVAYALTDKKGAFTLPAIPRNKTVHFMIFYTGYAHYLRVLKNIKKDTLDMGIIRISMSSHALNAVTVTGEKPPIAIKGDTVEFNASSFKTRPNSALAGLLKKLPGVDVDKEGNITANGEKVDKIMVDGKKFFGDDPKIALQNLPAAIIDKVQVTDTKTREEQLTGDPASGNTKTINVTLKKGKDHGVFGRAYAGYGTGKHYDASALMNYFEGKRQISLLGATNNINQAGFTIGEISNMIGMNNIHGISINKESGSFGINGINFGGGGEGIKKATSAGFNYNDAFGKHLTLNASYFYGGLKLDNETKTARQNILPDSIFYYNSDNVTHNNSISHRVSGTLHYSDSLLHIYYEPNISIGSTKGVNSSSAITTGAKGQKVNQSTSNYTTDEQTKQFNNRLSLYRTFKKKGQYIFAYFNADNSTDDGKNYNRYNNIFYDGSGSSDSVNQYKDNQEQNNQYSSRLSYNQPFSKALSLAISYSLNWQHGLTDKKTLDYNNATGKYSVPDTSYSNKFRSNIITQTPQAGLTLTLDSNKWRLNVNADFNFIGLHHHSFTKDVAFNQKQFFISPSVYLTRKISKRGSLRFDYRTFVQQPDISQLLPVADNSNPLYIVKGNPNLKPSITKFLTLYYYSFNMKTGNNIWTSIAYRTSKNDIVNVTTYDNQLRQLTSYANIDGNNSLRANIDLSKTKKEKNSHWQVKLNSSGRYNIRNAYVNGDPYKSKGYNITLRPSVTYGYKDLFEVTPSFDYNYQYNSYNVKALHNRKNTMYTAGFSSTVYWPSRITWESDWNYTRNSDVAPGFRKGYMLWNASVGVDIFKKKQATIQLSVYDLLNQNVSVHRNITDTYIEDTQTIILHRYFMLKLIYNLRKFGKKGKKKSNMPFFIF